MALAEPNPYFHPYQPEIDFDQLKEEFRFDLKGHELVEPTFTRGYVTRVEQQESVSMAGEKLPEQVEVFDIYVADPFTTADPEGYKIVKDYTDHIGSLVRNYGFDPLEERRKDHPYMGHQTSQRGRDYENEFTVAWFSDESVRAVSAWHSHIPSAMALSQLMYPQIGERVTDKYTKEEIISTPEATAQFRFVDDAVAIRTRAAAMQGIAESHLEGLDNTKRTEWLSLACGTAEPSIAAAKAVSERGGHDIGLTVVDIDKQALKHVEENAAKHEFSGNVRTLRKNILKSNIADVLKQETDNPEGFDVVEILGFEEYLPEPGDDLGACRENNLVHASQFTRYAFEALKPGGVLISGNMVVDRPQRDFVFGIVNWPLINARSEESILRVFENAGILDDPNVRLQLYRVKDEVTGTHVYDIVKVEKPVEEETGRQLPSGTLRRLRIVE